MANPYAPPQASVRDVAERHGTAVLAEPSTRLGATVLDSLIFSAMVYGPLLVGVALSRAMGSADDGEGSLTGLGLTGALAFLGFIAYVWLNLKQMKETGQSLGKKYCDIKVVRSDGSPISLGRLVWLRNGVNWLISMVPLYGLIDVLFIFGAERKCLHDKLADTIVIKA